MSAAVGGDENNFVEDNSDDGKKRSDAEDNVESYLTFTG